MHSIKKLPVSRGFPNCNVKWLNTLPLWEIKLENGKILTEARYRFDVLKLTEPEVSNDPGNSDSPPTVPEELMHLFQSEIYESDDSSVSAVPSLLLL